MVTNPIPTNMLTDSMAKRQLTVGGPDYDLTHGPTLTVRIRVMCWLINVSFLLASEHTTHSELFKIAFHPKEHTGNPFNFAMSELEVKNFCI